LNSKNLLIKKNKVFRNEVGTKPAGREAMESEKRSDCKE